MKQFFLPFFLLFNILAAFASGFGDSTQARGKSAFLPVPLIGYAQETRFQLGASVLYSFYADKTSSRTRNSNMVISGIYTLNRQAILGLYANTWTADNRYHYVVDVSYSKYPDKFYGTGNNTLLADADLILGKRIYAGIDVEKKFREKFYAGAKMVFHSDHFSDLGERGIYEKDSTLNGRDGGSIFLTGISLIYDTRDYYTYATNGSYIKLHVSATPGLSFNDYSLVKYELQGRKFFSINGKNALGVHLIFKSVQGEIIPFYFLSQMGSDVIMRGYFKGRYRDKNHIASQVEYRWRPLKRIAFVGFAGIGQVFDNGVVSPAGLKPNYGGGLRYFFEPASRLTLRFDYGFGDKRAGEKRSQGFYLSVNEAF